MKGIDRFDFLRMLALDLGAVDAKVIPTSEIVVENRVVLKCRVGCDDYRKKLTCPPFTPTVDEFRKMLKEYSYALLIKFKSQTTISEEAAKNFLRCQYDPTIGEKQKEKVQKFLSDWRKDKKRILLAVLELEKTAFIKGYTFAVGFTSGSCILCEKCNVEMGNCIHPTMTCLPEHAVGVNMKKTAEEAGILLTFPVKGRPKPTALLLID
jgi:predicted metal-binding protein